MNCLNIRPQTNLTNRKHKGKDIEKSFSVFDSQNTSNRNKNRQMGLYQTEKLLLKERNNTMRRQTRK
jgi:hypothetical protein